MIVNPRPMKSVEEILKDINDWLETSNFPINNYASEERFISKWGQLSASSIIVLSALIEEGGVALRNHV